MAFAGRCDRIIAPLRAALAIAGMCASIAPALAVAQTPQPQPSATSAPSACELHVWPAATSHTTFQGWIHAGVVDGARRGVKGYPDLHAGALDTAQQSRLLAAVDWRAAFDDPALVVVVHAEPSRADDDRTRMGRLLAEASPPCYRELIITSAIVESEVFSKSSVRVMAVRKRFDGLGAAPVNFSSTSQARIQFTDADKARADAAGRMDAAVQAAFLTAVSRFAVMQSFH